MLEQNVLKLHLLILLKVLISSAVIQAQQPLKITYISDESNSSNFVNLLQKQMLEETQLLLRHKYEVEFNTIYCNAQNECVLDAMKNAFADESVDIILTAGIISGGLMSQLGNYPKPSIATTVINHELQQIPITPEGTSGVHNFAYVEAPFDIERDIKTLHRMYPFKKIAILVDEARVIRFINELYTNIVTELNAEFVIIDASGSPASTLANMPEDVDAVYVTPLFDLSRVQVQELYEGVHQRKLPTAGLLGEMMVNEGVLIGYATDDNLSRIPRRVAINISKILSGTDPADLPVEMPTYNENLIINMETARKTEVYPDFSLMSEALLINYDRVGADRTLTLESVIAEALANNLDIKISEKNLAIAGKDVGLAGADLRPEVNVSTSLSMIDALTSANSFGNQGRVNWFGSGNFSQVLLSEPAIANVAIQKFLQKTSDFELQQTQMDVVLDAASAYLTLLQAQSLVKIQHENLLVTQENYDIAKAKEAVGYSGASDIARWESELAQSNINLNNATAQMEQARFALNQLLNRPIAEEFNVDTIALSQSDLLVNDPRLLAVVKDYGVLSKFANFMVREAKLNLPELKQIEFSLAAQERLLLSQKRAFYLPTIALTGEINSVLDRINVPELSPELQSFGLGNTSNKPTWNIGVGIQYPILQGGRRKLNRDRTAISILQLQDQRTNLQNQLELRIRSALETAGATFSQVRLSEIAANAAEKNFKIVQDSYSQGLINITMLIDAQNAAIQTELNAINAKYQFILDFLSLERAAGFYYSLATAKEKDAFFRRLDLYLSGSESMNN